MKTLYTIFIIILLNISFLATAQDVHFSKFYNTPLILNPANTGNYIGNWRVITNYRNQIQELTNPYVTSTFAFDFPIYYYKQMASIGFIYINDNSADNTLHADKFYFSIAHFLKISEKSYLHMGFQVGYVFKRYSLDYLSFPDQFDMNTGSFNSDMASQENLAASNLSYLDLNWGFIWSRNTSNLNSEIGISMFHYNTPNESFYGEENDLPARYILHSYLEKKFTNNLFVKPKLLYTYHNKVNEILLGSDFGIFINHNSIKNIHIGGYYRESFNENIGSAIVSSGFNFKNFDISISYDFEFLNQKTDYTKTAFEISIIYIRPSTNVKNKTIPCEMF
ncbi:MAG: PorP/SprF family type IX secretion system membrane protein [Bacteroidales bacterium]|nr:PorP/SprF family type IX secretion system membrane protein [Bacteroidales bacterium]MBN2757032.1 PorP/SprF family type IX secretion system membrane protein [Bacteroidales bacterium]